MLKVGSCCSVLPLNGTDTLHYAPPFDIDASPECPPFTEMFAETVCDNFVPTIPALCCRTGDGANVTAELILGATAYSCPPQSSATFAACKVETSSVSSHEIFGIIAGVLVALSIAWGIAAFALDSEDVSTAFVVHLIVAVLLTTSNALNTVVAARLRNNSEVQIFEDDDGPSLAFIIVAGIAVAMSF